jgi:hypothetical protein
MKKGTWFEHESLARVVSLRHCYNQYLENFIVNCHGTSINYIRRCGEILFSITKKSQQKVTVI